MADPLYTRKQVTDHLNIDLETLRNWERHSPEPLASPAVRQASTRPDLYDTAGLARARLVARLRDIGLTYERIAEALTTFDDQLPDAGFDGYVLVDSRNRLHFILGELGTGLNTLTNSYRIEAAAIVHLTTHNPDSGHQHNSQTETHPTLQPN